MEVEVEDTTVRQGDEPHLLPGRDHIAYFMSSWVGEVIPKLLRVHGEA